MLFHEFGDKGRPAIVLLHGGGLSFWAYSEIIGMLKESYLLVPIIDGHGEDSSDFLSIEDSALKLIKYIEENLNGRVLAICGLSLGAQIAVEVLSKKSDIAEYAIIESALLEPIPGASALSSVNGLFYGLIKQKWFAKLQAKALSLPENMFERYFEDSKRMSKRSLVNISLSNGNYRLKDSVAESKVKTLIVVGEKELEIMKRSARMLSDKIPESELFIAHNMKHGEFSLLHPKGYTLALKKLINNKEPPV